jgi:2-dehydro-3-deoxyphosphooctonate aldolase (KDO 8-P synthase)
MTSSELNLDHFAILGPCVIESQEHTLAMASQVREAVRESKFTPIFKSSFQKANRSSNRSFSGLGISAGLEILQEVKELFGMLVTTDVHESHTVNQVAEVADILQIPAFLCRQTDLLQACAETKKVLNVKKAQFMSGYEMINVVEKLIEFGASEIILTERGTMFGYNNLIVDFRNLEIMKTFGVKVCMDATHSVQLPGAKGLTSGGQRQFVGTLARAAAITGVDGFFMETHDDPNNAPSDGPNMIPINQLAPLLNQLNQIKILQSSLEKLPFEDFEGV